MYLKEVKDIIVKENISNLNNKCVYAYKLTASAEKSKSPVQVLITSVMDNPAIQGSDKVRGIEQDIEVKLFYGENYNGTYDDEALDIIKILQAHRYVCKTMSGVTGLPDTDRLLVSIRFVKTKVLEHAI